MQNFLDRFRARSLAKRSVLCVGLDPMPDHVPPAFGDGYQEASMEAYLKAVIDLAAPKVPIVKPQWAYYGAWGERGMKILKNIVTYAKSRGLLVILDHKISDIGDTMERYGVEVFEQIGVDAVTAVPYLGSSIIKPLMRWLNHGCCVISMVRTSNPEAAEFQDLGLVTGELVYEAVAKKVRDWNDQVRSQTNNIGSVGAVIGATWPEQAVRCREILGPEVFTLVPGYGAQGGGADGAVITVGSRDGLLCGTVNSSRGITLLSWRDENFNPKPGDAMEHIAAAIDAANADLNKALQAQMGCDSYVKKEVKG